MRYSVLGKTGLKVSALGFGCMRLPMKDNHVERDKSTPMLRKAFDLGITFFDTAIGYCGSDSQPALGEALEPIRSKVVISTKNHHHTAPASEWRKALEDSLRLLRTDYIDLYNHHGISWQLFTERLDPAKGGLTKEMLRAKEEGLIRHIGFSFHAPADDLKKLCDTGYYENVILQYNLLDQANAEAIQYVHEKGMGVVVMGPVGGGRLGIKSEGIVELTGGAAKSTVEAALRFVWAHPGVNVALSGMESMQMLTENLAIAENTTPFTPEQTAALNRLVEERKKKSGLYCTGCRYCMPACAVGVSIPEQLDLLNLSRIYGLTDTARNNYKSPWSVKVKAAECVNCRKCVEKCPQGIDIPARMREVVTLLDARAGTVAVDTAMEELKPDGTFGLRLRCQSLADVHHDLSVKLTGAEGVSFKNANIEVKDLPAFGRRTAVAAGTYPGSDRHIDFGMDVRYAGRSEHVDKSYAFLLLAKGLSDDWRGGDWRESAPKADDFSSDKETAGKHGLRFKLSYDDAGLLLLADVKDDFLFPSQSKHKGQLVDCLELFLDGRPPSKVGKPAYDEGVYQIALYPGTPGEHAAFFNVCNSKKEMAIEIAAETTPAGYRLRAKIPFAAFAVDAGVPRKIGFDLAVNTANKEGQRICQYAWAGGADNWNNAGNFREVWLG